MILSWALIVGIVAWIVRAFAWRSDESSARADGATAILDERFARGEISEEDYRERRRVLEGSEP
jgi:putative membrane protein